MLEIISDYSNQILMLSAAMSLSLFLILNFAFRVILENRSFSIPKLKRSQEKIVVKRWPQISFGSTPKRSFASKIVNYFRREKISRQLPFALRAMASALKSGMNIEAALRIAKQEVDSPLSDVFDTVLRSSEYGLDYTQALLHVSDQVGSEEWDLFASGIALQRDTGGDLVHIIEQILKTIQDKQVVENELKSATASGKLSGLIVALLAPLGLVLFYIFSPDYISVLFTSEAGRVSLLFALVLEMIGGFWIWKVTKLDF